MLNTKRLKYILGSIALLVLTATSIRSSMEVFRSKGRLDEVKREISALEEEKRKIEEEIAFKKTDEYIEETARNELNLVKPDEEIYVVITSAADKSNSSVLSDSSSREGGVGSTQDKNWYSWYKLFFDN